MRGYVHGRPIASLPVIKSHRFGNRDVAPEWRDEIALLLAPINKRNPKLNMHAVQRVRQIGLALKETGESYSCGAQGLMQAFFDGLLLNDQKRKALSEAWQGIGEWGSATKKGTGR